MDINTIRAYKGGDPEKVRESQRRRFADVALVDKVIAEDEEWRRLVALADDKRGEKNAKQKEITALKKAKKEVDPQMLKDLKALGAVPGLRTVVTRSCIDCDSGWSLGAQCTRGN